MARILLLIFAVFMFLSCETAISGPEDLVPPTVIDDPNLPSLSIEVGGKIRKVHFRTYGDPADRPLLVVHGSLSDMRPYLVLSELESSHYVVFWDMRGNGLSERVPREELSFDFMVEEFHAVKEAVSPDRPVIICGASWSAVFAALYIQKYPDDVEKAILMEPIGLKDEYMKDVGQSLNLFQAGYLEMNWASEFLTAKDHDLLDYRMHMMISSGVREFFCDTENKPDWPVWRVGGLALIVWESQVLDGMAYSYDFTANTANFSGPVLFVGTNCSPIGYIFQEEFNLPLFSGGQSLRIENSGHRLVTEQPAALLEGLREFLSEE